MFGVQCKSDFLQQPAISPQTAHVLSCWICWPGICLRIPSQVDGWRSVGFCDLLKLLAWHFAWDLLVKSWFQAWRFLQRDLQNLPGNIGIPLRGFGLRGHFFGSTWARFGHILAHLGPIYTPCRRAGIYFAKNTLFSFPCPYLGFILALTWLTLVPFWTYLGTSRPHA